MAQATSEAIPKMAWGNPSTTSEPNRTAGGPSLREIMDETLATKLQDEADIREYEVVTSDNSEVMQSDDDDLALARALQETIALDDNGEEVANHAMDEQTAIADEDLALALQLQAEEEANYFARNGGSHSAPNAGNVQLQHRSDPYLDQLHQNEVYRNVVSSPSKKGSFDTNEEYFDANSRSLPRELAKDNDGNWISKHDSELSALKNAETLERNYDDIYIGDRRHETKIPGKTFNKLRNELKKREKVKGISQASGSRVEKNRFATQEAVMDERTRLLLFKLASRGDVLSSVEGLISSGKEARVYFALGVNGETQPDAPPSMPYLVAKIFMTTLTEFRNRGDYVKGDHRYDSMNFDKKSTMQQSKIWTQKAFANLSRAHSAGIRCPRPLMFKENVVLMEFIGHTEDNPGSPGSVAWTPAPTLRDVTWRHRRQAVSTYAEVIYMLRKLFHVCELVHGDLSEYNILYHKKLPYLIDFGQAVATSHPDCLKILRNDVKNINAYFRKQQKKHEMFLKEQKRHELEKAAEAAERVLAMEREQEEEAKTAMQMTCDGVEGGESVLSPKSSYCRIPVEDLNLKDATGDVDNNDVAWCLSDDDLFTYITAELGEEAQKIIDTLN
jgi:serine/threonine-protein kinase RIO1